MKHLLLFFSILLLGALTHKGYSQSVPFSKSVDLNLNSAIPVPYFATITSKSADVAKKGVPVVFDGNPTREEVHKVLFKDPLTKGRYFMTYPDHGPTAKEPFRVAGKDPLVFDMYVSIFPPDLLPSIFLGSNYRINDYLDKVVVSIGDINIPGAKPSEREVRTIPGSTEITVPIFWSNQTISIPASSFPYAMDRTGAEINSNTDYTRLVIYRMYKNNKVIRTLILPVLIVGTGRTKIGEGLGPFELITILRPPPGDQSYTEFRTGKELSREVSLSLTDGREETSTQKVEGKVGFGGLGGSLSDEKSETRANVDGKSKTYLISTRATETYTNKTKSDMFVYQQLDVDYMLETQVIAAGGSGSGLQVFTQSNLALEPYEGKNIRDGRVTTRRSTTAATLLGSGAGSLERLRRQNKKPEVSFWESVLKMNDRIKAKATLAKGGQNVGPGEREFESTNSSTEGFSQEVSFSSSHTVTWSAEAGLEIGPLSASVSYENTNTVTISTSTSQAVVNGVTNSKTVLFHIEDDDDDDVINAIMKEDGSFGTPVFELNPTTSVTSCPYEGGDRVDEPEIVVKDPITAKAVKTAKYSDMKPTDRAIFEFTVSNKSSLYDRSFQFTIEAIDLPPIDYLSGISGSNQAIPLKAGESKIIRIRASNVDPTNEAYANQGFKDIKVILSPICDPASADTVTLGVFYGDSDENRAPDNSLIAAAVLLPSDGSLQTQYTNKFGKSTKITNKNARSTPDLQVLVPPANCQTGWCPETDGKPEITNAVWFKFVVTTPKIDLTTCYDMNAAFDSQLAVYKVGDIKDKKTYVRIGANDKKLCKNNSSRVYMENLTIGDTLYVLVDGFQGAQSDFGISVKAVGPANDLAENPEIIGFVKGELLTGFYNIGATVEEGETDVLAKLPAKDPVISWKEDDSVQNSVWFQFAPPAGGEVVIEVLNATFDAQIMVFNGTAGGDPSYFRQLEFLGANDDITPAGGLNSRILIKGLDPRRGKYTFLVDGFEGQVGYFDVKVSIPTPTNDEPCNAITLETDATGQGVFSNGGASASNAEQAIAPPTVEINKPGGWSDKAGDSRARQIEKSVWFKFVAPSGGAVQISTCNQSSFSLQMAVYTTTNCNDWSKYKLVAADDNSQICRIPPNYDYPNGTGVRGSILNLTGLVADSTYYVLIDGSLNAFGQFSINIITAPSDPPVNDAACNAIALPANGVIQKGYTNMGATTTKTEYKIVPKEWKDKSMSGTVWFKFVAPASGVAEISTCDLANFDTQLAVYTVPDCKVDSNFVLVGANEDGPSSCSTRGDSFLPLKGLTPGQTYYIVVDGYGTNKGNFSIVVRDKLTPGPANDNADKAILIAVDGKVNTGYTNAYATVQVKEQDIRPKPAANQDCTTGWCDNQVDNSVWFKFVAPADGKANISTCDLAVFDTQLAVYSATNENDLSTFTLIAANDAGPQDCSTNFDIYLPVSGLTAGRTYYILVDGFNGASGTFDISISPTPDTQAPSAPSNLQATDTKQTSISISWTASTDNVGVKEYLVYLNGNQAATTTTTTHTFSNLTPATAYQISVKAKDAAGNESAASTTLNVTTTAVPDTQAPTAPGSPTATDITTSSVKVNWGASSDNVGVKEYRVYVDNVQKATTSETTFTLTGLTSGTNYAIYIVAVDAAGNASNPSTTLNVTTTVAADTQAPTTPANLTATEVTTTSVKITWGASTDNVGVKEYRVYLDAALKGTTTNTTFTLSDLTAATAYSIYVVAVDAAGNTSNPSTALKVTTAAAADTQAPTAPSSLAATETNSTDVKVSWTASTDNVGVKEYRVFVDNTQTVTSTTTSATITGLTASTAYSIHVVAVDAAGNVSGSSNVLKVTTAAVTVTIVLSVSPSSQAEEVKAYPNPFRDEIILEFPSGFHYVGNVEVRDILGRAVQNRNLNEATNQKLTLDMASQPTGMFFLIIRQKDSVIHKQLLKR